MWSLILATPRSSRKRVISAQRSFGRGQDKEGAGEKSRWVLQPQRRAVCCVPPGREAGAGLPKRWCWNTNGAAARDPGRHAGCWRAVQCRTGMEKRVLLGDPGEPQLAISRVFLRVGLWAGWVSGSVRGQLQQLRARRAGPRPASHGGSDFLGGLCLPFAPSWIPEVGGRDPEALGPDPASSITGCRSCPRCVPAVTQPLT